MRLDCTNVVYQKKRRPHYPVFVVKADGTRERYETNQLTRTGAIKKRAKGVVDDGRESTVCQ